MKNTLIALVLLLSAITSFGQTVVVSGHPVTGQGTTSSSGTSILFELKNTGTQQCRIAGTGLITPTSFTVTQAQLAAGINIYPNSSIVCGTSTGNTRWLYTVKAGGLGAASCSLNITASTNLDSTTCLNANPTPVTTTPTDSVFCKIDGSNCGFTGAVTDTASFGAPLFNVTGSLNATIANDTAGGINITSNGGKVWEFANGGALSSPVGAPIQFNGATSGLINVAAPAVAGANNLTLPAATGTISCNTCTQTLTATTLTNPAINGQTADTITQKAATQFLLKDNTGGTRLSIPSNGTSPSVINNAAIGGSSVYNGTTQNFQKFTSTGTFTIPAGVTSVEAVVIGAGGAGGGATTTTGSGGGGMGGGYAIKYLTGLTPGNTITVTVGTGGTGVSNASGNNGGNSSISSGTQTITTVTANGGSGGTTSGIAQPNSTGISTNGDINGAPIFGQINAFANSGGVGGPSLLGGGGQQGLAGAGGAGNVPGAGGGGAGGQAAGGVAGGAGANGTVIFRWNN